MQKSLVLFFFKSTYFWSSRLQMFFKVGVLKSYAIFTGNHLRWSHFCIKFQSFRPATLKVTPTKVLFGEYCKFFKNSFFIEHLRWLLLLLSKIFISRCDKIISIYKFWSVNSDWLTDWLFSYAEKLREGILLISKCC